MASFSTLLLAVLAVAAAAAAAPSPPPPKPTFSEDMTLQIAEYYIMSYGLGSGEEVLSTSQSTLLVNVTRLEPTTQQNVTMVQFFTKDGMYISHNDNCKFQNSSKFYNPFDWVMSSATVFEGVSQVNGIDCNMWRLNTPHTNLTMCATDTVPLSLRYDMHSYPTMQKFVFGMAVPTADIPPVPVSCRTNPLCGSGKATVFDVYIFHPNTTTGDIVNENVADLLGDTLFVCADAVSNNTANDKYAYVSHYEVEMLEKWGKYQECNEYPGYCIGGNDMQVTVGREASFGVTPNSGQCTENKEYGNWFSLPQGGKCKSDDEKMSIETGCTWRIKKRVKTIDATCLLKDRGMLESCLAERRLPLTKTRKIFADVFASDDTAKGGCPNVVPN